MELLLYILAGAAVGFAIGLTGVGGGSLMTPLLLMFGYPAPVAIGTDLLYAALTKAGGAWSHHRAGNVDWRIVGFLAAGSIPTALAVHGIIAITGVQDSAGFANILTQSLGVMLIITASFLFLRNKLREKATREPPGSAIAFIHARRGRLTFMMGMLLGVCVTLSSVGAGAFAAALLLVIYSQTAAVKIIGSDIAHAVPLTLIAGLGYLFSGYVDLMLLASLLLGSLPAIRLGTKLSKRMAETTLQTVLITLLLGLGLFYTISGNLH